MFGVYNVQLSNSDDENIIPGPLTPRPEKDGPVFEEHELSLKMLMRATGDWITSSNTSKTTPMNPELYVAIH
jgi:hypothetical protein